MIDNQSPNHLIICERLIDLLSEVSRLESDDAILASFVKGLNKLVEGYTFDLSSDPYPAKDGLKVAIGDNQFGVLHPSNQDRFESDPYQKLFKGATKMLAVTLENRLIKNDDQETSSVAESKYSLQKEVDLFNSFFETIPAHMYIKDAESGFIKINSSMRRLFRVADEEDINGKNDFDFFDKEHAQEAFDDERQIIKTGKPKIGYEEKETWPDGRVSWVLSTKMPVFDTNGKVVGLVGLSKDITRLKKMEEELKGKNEDLEVALEKVRKGEELKETLEKLKETQVQLVHSEKMASVGMLVAGVAHEINNPLNYIQGAKDAIEQYLKAKSGDFSQLNSFLKIIEHGVSRASDIVKGLNRFNRYSNNYNEKCDIHLIIDNCLTLLKGEMKSKISVEKKFTEASFELIGNEGELHQAMLNFLNNAIQSIPEKGLISIITKLRANRLTIEIMDTGSGIKKEDLKKITEPFFTTKEPGKGTGLGTTISSSIIKNHAGEISYASEIGKGTTVTISLPISLS